MLLGRDLLTSFVDNLFQVLRLSEDDLRRVNADRDACAGAAHAGPISIPWIPTLFRLSAVVDVVRVVDDDSRLKKRKRDDLPWRAKKGRNAVTDSPQISQFGLDVGTKKLTL